MNRKNFFKRLIGGIVAAPIVAKAIVEEKPKTEVIVRCALSDGTASSNLGEWMRNEDGLIYVTDLRPMQYDDLNPLFDKLIEQTARPLGSNK